MTMLPLFDNPSVDKLISEKEGQLFDRKTAGIHWTSLVDFLIGFANADGGLIVLGIDKDKTILGVEDISIKAAEIRKAGLTLATPPLPLDIKSLPCKNFKGENSNVLMVEIRQSSEVHANQKDEVFLRIGDENIKLNLEQRMLLLDDRGKKSFELLDAQGSTLPDLNNELIEEYKHVIKSPTICDEDLLIGRDLAKWEKDRLVINMAGILLFGEKPERWVERARVRILKYEGRGEKTGEKFNVTKDISIYGSLLSQIRQAQSIITNLLREFTSLDNVGKFITQSEYPDFAWKEALINAIVHRSYRVRGADIQVKMFDDHLEIISPGRFPGPVNERNIKDTHYSRNPRIARVMTEFGFVRELGEGINRIIDTMAAAHLPSPSFTEKAESEVLVMFQNNIDERTISIVTKETSANLDKEVLQTLSKVEIKIVKFTSCHSKITTKECKNLANVHRTTAINYLNKLCEKDILYKIGEKGPTVYYILGKKLAPINTTKDNQNQLTKPKQRQLFEDQKN